MSGIFITGTDTGVGKTLVAAGLLQALRGAGVDAVPMKPVQTGCVRRRGVWVAPDLALSLKTAGLDPSADEIARMAPYCFHPACSPHLAARLAGRRISLLIIRRAFRQLEGAHDLVVVEGAGGVLVPLDRQLTMVDMMKSLALPIVLVARPGLGTINHTLLSIHALRHAGLTVKAVVLNQSSSGRLGRIERDNRKVIESMGAVPVVAVLGFGMTASRAARALAPLAAMIRMGRPTGRA
jgi:dethiobiotin synthetase